MFSQAAILQHTADYIYQLEQEKTRLLSQNCQLKRLVSKQEGELLSTASVHKKRKIDDSTGKYAALRCVIREGVEPGMSDGRFWLFVER